MTTQFPLKDSPISVLTDARQIVSFLSTATSYIQGQEIPQDSGLGLSVCLREVDDKLGVVIEQLKNRGGGK